MHLLKLERLLREGVNKLGNPIFLIFRAEGIYPAGSLSTHHEDRWSVLWELEGARHGTNYANLADAEARFNSLNCAKKEAFSAT